MNWSLAFEPLFSWPVLAAMLAPLGALALVGLWFARRGAWLRALALHFSTRCSSTKTASP